MTCTSELTVDIATKILEEFDGDGYIELENAVYEFDGCTAVVSASVEGQWWREKETGAWIKDYIRASVEVSELYDEEYQDIDLDLDEIAREIEQLIEDSE